LVPQLPEIRGISVNEENTMSERQWVKAWPTAFRKDLKAAGLSDSDIDGVMQATTMEKALSYLPKATIDRNKALSEVLKQRFGHR
jgi:hypothetical protein